jgi:hypothetical protein
VGDANIKDDPVKQSNKRGMVTFAKTSGPIRDPRKCIINFGDNAGLDVKGSPRSVPCSRAWMWSTKSTAVTASARSKTNHRSGRRVYRQEFPMIDKIKMAKILPAEPAAAPAAKSAPADKSAPANK